MHQATRIAGNILLILGCLFISSVRAQMTGQQVLQGMGIAQSEIDQLESGNILAYSDAEYESTNRELAADAIALVDSDLSAVREALQGATTLIPTKDTIDLAEIKSTADFAGIEYVDDEFEEVERLFGAKPGKKFNFSAAEYAMLESRLRPHRRASRADKIKVASDAIRELLIGRYDQYRASGLDGIAEYKRSRRKQINIGRELFLTTETFKPFADDFPQYFNVMGNYPDGTECCESYFRWLKVKIRGRPVFVLAHTLIQETDDFILFTERHYFANNTLNSVQITLSWLPYDEDTYMGIAMSASADILDSLMGRMLRPLGRNKAKDLVTDVMQDFRDELQTHESGDEESM